MMTVPAPRTPGRLLGYEGLLGFLPNPTSLPMMTAFLETAYATAESSETVSS
jgi:hypothetical protein